MDPSQNFENSLDHGAFDGESVIDTLRGDEGDSVESFKLESEDIMKMDKNKPGSDQKLNTDPEQVDSDNSIVNFNLMKNLGFRGYYQKRKN